MNATIKPMLSTEARRLAVSAVFCAALLAGPCLAADTYADIYFTNPESPLTTNEKAALKLVREWKDSGGMAHPLKGPGGEVQFVFDASQPTIVCAVLQVTDVRLEPGEQVLSVHLGDSARWSIEPAITGNGPAETQHLIIKPRDVGLETSLVVTTNRRSYHLRLKSTRKDYMPKVSFVYPESFLAKWNAIEKKRAERIESNTMPDTGEYLGNLDFGYKVSGDAGWKPERVYNDGVKTIIQMPKAMRDEAPTLLVVRKEGGFFSEDETVLVNYRLQGNRYIVDTLFDKAILIAGVGRSQDKVTILRVRR